MVYQVGAGYIFRQAMGRRRTVYQISADTWLVCAKRPKKVSGPEAQALLRDMLEARRPERGASYLTAAERKARAQKAAAARWEKRRKKTP
jgi:hypothetical protein